MSQVTKFEQTLSNNLESNVKGFDFSILLPILLEILTSLLGNCLNKRGDEVVMTYLSDPSNIWTRIAARQATNEAFEEINRSRDHKSKRVVRTGILQTCGACTPDELEELVEEVEEGYFLV